MLFPENKNLVTFIQFLHLKMSDSEEFEAPSTSKEPQKKKQKTEDNQLSVRYFENVWDYYEKKGDDMAECDICSKQISRKGGSTSGMRRHLTKIHQMLPKEQNKTQTLSTSKVKKQTSITQYANKNNFDVDAAISEMVKNYLLQHCEMSQNHD